MIPRRSPADRLWGYTAERPWAFGAIQLKPMGLRECVARVVLFRPGEVERQARESNVPSLLRDVARWRLADSLQWQELVALMAPA